jgi:hypothetical protein
MAGESGVPLHLCVEKLLSVKASKLPASLAADPFFSNFFGPPDGFCRHFTVLLPEGKKAAVIPALQHAKVSTELMAAAFNCKPWQRQTVAIANRGKIPACSARQPQIIFEGVNHGTSKPQYTLPLT